MEHILSDDDCRAECIEHWYELAGLSAFMPLDRFRSWLRREREKLVIQNWKQIAAYLDTLRQRNVLTLSPEMVADCPFSDTEAQRILVEPKPTRRLAQLLFCRPTVATVQGPNLDPTENTGLMGAEPEDMYLAAVA